MQNTPTHDTPEREGMPVACGAPQAVPFQLMADPEASTAMQSFAEPHDSDVSSPGDLSITPWDLQVLAVCNDASPLKPTAMHQVPASQEIAVPAVPMNTAWGAVHLEPLKSVSRPRLSIA